jgi:hypothetical protein
MPPLIGCGLLNDKAVEKVLDSDVNQVGWFEQRTGAQGYLPYSVFLA